MAQFQKVKHGTMHCWSLFLEYYIEEEECGTPLTLINEIIPFSSRFKITPFSKRGRKN